MARIGTIALVLAAPLILQAQEDLPAGAIARLGSTRFRHVGWITAIAYSPDGERIATGCIDGKLRMWDAASGQLEWKSPAGAMVTSIDFSPDGTLVAAGSFQGWRGGRTGLDVLVAASGRVARHLSIPAYGVRSVAFSPDGRRLAIGTGTPETPPMQALPDAASFVEIRDLKTGHRDRKLPGHAGAVTSVAYSPDGRTLATAGPEGDLRITDLTSGRTLHENERGGHTVAYSPDGGSLAAGSWTGLVRILEPATGKTVREVAAETPGMRSIAFSPDGRKLGVTAPGVRVCIWDTTSWDREHTIHLTARSCLPSTWDGLAYPLAFSPDGKRLAVASNDHVIQFIDTATGKDLSDPGGHRGFVADLAFSPDSHLLASTGGDGLILLWDPSTRDLLHAIDTGDPPHHALAFSPDGKSLAVGGRGDEVRAFRVPDGRRIRSWALKKAARRDLPVPFLRETPGAPSVQGVAFSTDGERLLASTSDGWLYALDPAGDEVETLDRPPRQGRGPLIFQVRSDVSNLLHLGPWSRAYPETLACGPEGGPLAHRSSPASIDVTGPRGIEIDAGEMIRFSTLAILPDGGALVAGSSRGDVSLYEMATGRRARTMATWGGPVTSVAVSPDGAILAWTDVSRSIHLWHFGRTDEATSIPDAGQGILTLAFSPDGKLLASAGLDGTITLWDVDLISSQTWPSNEGIDEETLESMWTGLALGDAKAADASMWALAHAPDDSLPFLAKRFQPAPGIDPERFRALLEDLDHDDFGVREKATQDLIAIGPAIEDHLIAALDSRASPEVQDRLDRILSGLRPPFRQFPSEGLRRIRTVRALERMGTPGAASLLRSYARRCRSEREIHAIEAAIRRMGFPREF